MVVIVRVDVDAGAVAGTEMGMVNCFVALFPAASVTWKVKVLVPALTGVPDNTPAEVKVMPVLQEPLQDGSDQL